ncbi:MAG: hypothetical protein JOZ02_21620 [Acidobacteria bacterium]|nr:hypothetical protein [Acidobacteriota bacterium]
MEAPTGTWGGEHIGLEVTEDGGRVEYDCAHGTIDRRIITDAEGGFELRGTHVRERGGPVRKGVPEDSHPAVYKGRIKGDTMTLTVEESDTGQSVGTFTLKLGREPHVVKCR